MSDELKRKLRKLKRLEKKIRFHGEMPSGARLVWDSFFDLRNTPESGARYSLRFLAALSRDEYKLVVDEFFARVYYELYRENGIIAINTYDPAILVLLNLPFNAGIDDIKKRFRELAKRFHPDTGGDAHKFIELMSLYEKLIGR